MMTPIVVPIFVRDLPGTVAALHQAVAAGAGMVELRCDTTDRATLAAVLHARRDLTRNAPPLPVIVTVRPKWEGGFYEGTDAERIPLFEEAAAGGAEYLDVELVAWQQSAELRQRLTALCPAPPPTPPRPKLILSNHDFTGRPADLSARLQALADIPQASVLKLVWQAASVCDGIDALRLTHQHAQRDPRPLLALAMGEPGQISRLLGAKFGQPFTFATLPHDPGSAPGQPAVTDLLGLYRWHQQQLDTPVFAVLGWPVGHSLSPAIHNAGFTQLGVPGVYVPLPVRPDYEAFAATLDALRACPAMNLRGLSVTIPHKENALRYVRTHGGTIDDLSAHIGVLNTIILPPDGSLLGLNSDYAGALDALVHAMGIRREALAQRRVAVIGAGGAARAIVAGLAAYGATTTIYNRTLPRAQELAADFHGRRGPVAAATLDELGKSACHIYINCTPLGMHPHVDATPFPNPPAYPAGTVVFDTVYNPLKTKFLADAEARGATIVTGMEMFLRQAAVQFAHFTGQPAPIDTFRRIMLAHLQPKP